MSHMIDGQEYTDRVPPVPAEVKRRAQVHLSDRIAAQYPHPLDEEQPREVGRQLAKNPFIAAELALLLDAFGLEAS